MHACIAHTHTHTHAHTSTGSCTNHTHTQTHTHTHTNRLVHALTALSLSLSHTHTHINTHTHRHRHTLNGSFDADRTPLFEEQWLNNWLQVLIICWPSGSHDLWHWYFAKPGEIPLTSNLYRQGHRSRSPDSHFPTDIKYEENPPHRWP